MGLPKLLQQIQSTYLPNSGGTVNGVITCTQPRAMEGSDSNNYFVIAATKNDAYKNSSLFLHNMKASENAGCFQLRASDGTTTKVFHGSPTGTLSWDGQMLNVFLHQAQIILDTQTDYKFVGLD